MIKHNPIYILLLALAAPLACGDGSGETAAETATETATATATATETATDSSSGTPTTGGPEATTGGAPDFYACEELAFGPAPLAGPGWDADKGGIQGELQPGYVLHTTQIYIKPEGAQEFLELAQAISAEAAKTEGLIAFSVGSDMGCGVARTMGIWANEEAMYKLVASEVHTTAMGRTTALSYTGKTTHWAATVEEANAYSWEVARAKLVGVEPSPFYGD